MEIRKSPGRFISIFFIVMLGVAFFSGIRASEPSMRITGDAYYDSANLMDIKAFSTYSVTEDSFDLDVYTEMYVQVEGAKELVAYTDKYEGKVDEVLERIEVEAEKTGKST